MKFQVILGILVVVALASSTVNANNMYRRLMRKIKSKLSPDLVPYGKDREAVNVSMTVTLIDITEANIHKKRIEVEVWLKIGWNAGVTWEKSRFGFDSVRIAASDMWTPDVCSYNGYSKFDNQAPPIAVISNTGETAWFLKTKIEAKCDITNQNLTNSQTCIFKFGSWTHSGFEINLQDPEGSVDLSNYESTSKFAIQSSSMEREVTYYSCCPEPYQHYTFTVTFNKIGHSETA